jgi:hypothetical protein
MPAHSENRAQNKELSVADLQSQLSRFEDNCRKWLTGAISTADFERFSDTFYETTYSLEELGGKSDDFDWDTFPRDLMKHCNATLERYENVSSLIYAINQTIQKHKPIAASLDDSLLRIVYFCREFNSRAFNPKLLQIAPVLVSSTSDFPPQP